MMWIKPNKNSNNNTNILNLYFHTNDRSVDTNKLKPNIIPKDLLGYAGPG